MRYGYRFISLLWAPVLIIAIHNYRSFTPYYSGYDVQLAITSSSFLVFSFIVNYMAVLATRQRIVSSRARRLAFLDPVVHLPNLRALNRALRSAPGQHCVFCAFLNWNFLLKIMALCCVFSTSSKSPTG